MERPRIDIGLSRADWALEAIGALGLFVTFVYTAFNYEHLPEIIPTHFNGSGIADGFSNRITIWILPSIMLVIYTALTIALRYPYAFNYPSGISQENAGRQYRNAILMMRTLKTVIVVCFSYVTYATIQNGMGNMDGLGIWFLPVFLVLILGPVGIFAYRGVRMK